MFTAPLISPPPSEAPRRERPSVGRTATSLCKCLIVSKRPAVASLLSAPAEEVGWQVVHADEAGDALRKVVLHRFGLAFIDTQASQHRPLLSQVARRVGSESRGVTVACGSDDDPSAEMWAREVGAWVYLPGELNPVGIRSLCAQALALHQKLNKPADAFAQS